MPERKWKLHISANLFGKRSYQASIKDGLGGDLGKRVADVKQYQKSEKKWKKELKISRNITICSIAWLSARVHAVKSRLSKRSTSRHPRKMINLAAIDLAVIMIPECKEMNKLYHAMTNNIKNKDQHNDAIEYDPKFDSKFSLSSGTKDPLPEVNVSLLGGKKHRVTIIDVLTCLWDSVSNNITIKRLHTKPYGRNMNSNKVECSTSSGQYCTTHDIKMTFFMNEFSRSNTISHRFHIYKNEGESGIVY